jgi:epsilon-lactone hydrolase
MPSTKAIALSTLMRMVVKPSFATINGVEELRSGALRLFDRVSFVESGTTVESAPLTQCESDWVYPQGIETDRVVLYLPGGAFVVRTPGLHRSLAGRIARSAHARARVVFYRLAPEHPFPAGLEDCIEAYESLLAGGVAPSRIVLGGDSAGGNLALALLFALRERGRPLPAAAFALSPVTDMRNHTRGTRTTNQQADPLLSTLHSNRLNIHEIYVGGNKQRLKDPLVSPILGDFRGLPPLMFQVGSTEILLDDSRRAVKKARQAGVDAMMEIWAKMPHVWHGWKLPESKRAISHLADFIRQHCP